MARDLGGLTEYAASGTEAARLQEALAAFADYRRVVTEEQRRVARRHRAGAMRLAATDAPGFSGPGEAPRRQAAGAAHGRRPAARAEGPQLAARPRAGGL